MLKRNRPAPTTSRATAAAPVAKLETFDVTQGTEEWHQLRLGIPTASKFKVVMASGRGSNESRTRYDYLCDLAGEKITGRPAETFSNAHMERGREWEPEARKLYAFQTEADVKQIGFARRGRAGCSPDGLIGNDGAVEFKSMLPRLLIKVRMRGEYPPEHEAQCQGTLWILEREWIDISIYCRDMPLFVQRIYRNDAYIRGLAMAVDQFNGELVHMMRHLESL